MSTIEEKIEQFEREGKFNEHLDGTTFGTHLAVDGNYKYLHKGFFGTIKDLFYRAFVQYPFRKIWCKKGAMMEVRGRENIKGIKHAVIACNHVHIFDCGAVITAFRGKKVYTIGASFNNFSGLLGNIMRAGRMLPLGETPSAQKNFTKAVSEVLTKKGYILIFPERAEWTYYKKPRPFLDGAFHYAVKNNVPVIPTFITFKETNKIDKEGNKRLKFIVNILPPIYQKSDLNNHENQDYLKEATFNAMKDKYEEFYNIPLRYNTNEE